MVETLLAPVFAFIILGTAPTISKLFNFIREAFISLLINHMNDIGTLISIRKSETLARRELFYGINIFGGGQAEHTFPD